MLQAVPKRFSGFAIVAAPGPSLSSTAEACRGYPVVAVQDAWRLVPWASVLYGCDARWWDHHQGAPGFSGERWATHEDGGSNDQRKHAERFGLNLVAGAHQRGFSVNPKTINYGSNSGFQAINLALLMGATTIALVGFDWRQVDGKTHFFGEHPDQWQRPNFGGFTGEMEFAGKHLPPGVQVFNCTPHSALRAFPMRPIDDLCHLAEFGRTERVPVDADQGEAAASGTA